MGNVNNFGRTFSNLHAKNADLRKLENCKFAETHTGKLGDPQPRCKFALRIRVRTYFPQH